MCEVLTPILKGIDYNPVKANHNLWGIITPSEKYLALHNAAFVVPVIRFLLDTTIPEGAPNSVIHKAEAEHTVRRNDHALYDAANNGVVKLFYTIVDDTWYQDLKGTSTYYSEVTATEILAKFRANCSGLHEVDAISIQGEMMGDFGQAEVIPQYINPMEAAQVYVKQSRRWNTRPPCTCFNGCKVCRRLHHCFYPSSSPGPPSYTTSGHCRPD